MQGSHSICTFLSVTGAGVAQLSLGAVSMMAGVISIIAGLMAITYYTYLFIKFLKNYFKNNAVKPPTNSNSNTPTAKTPVKPAVNQAPIKHRK